MTTGLKTLSARLGRLSGRAIIAAGGLMLFACDDPAGAARQAEKLEKLGAIWGEVQVAEDNCPHLTVNNLTAQELLRDLGKLRENSLAVMARLASEPVWKTAYESGAKAAQSERDRLAGPAFCDAMWKAYGSAGSRMPNLLKMLGETATPRS